MALHADTPEMATPRLASVSHIAEHLDPPDNLKLVVALQTTLDVEAMITLFDQETRAMLAHDGLRYENRAQDLELTCGTWHKHRVSYNLELHADSLGAIAFSRSHPFEESELERAEYLLAALVYPLRNALLYRQAIEAMHKDPLTGVGNRAAMNEALTREIELARRNRTPLALLVVDLDHFKAINDSYGHNIGDLVLKSSAQRLENALRSTDQVFRYGGEEFVIVLSQTDQQGAALVAERLRRAISRNPIFSETADIHVTASLGVAHYREGMSGEILFQQADEALYQAKRDGRDRTVVAGQAS